MLCQSIFPQNKSALMIYSKKKNKQNRLIEIKQTIKEEQSKIIKHPLLSFQFVQLEHRCLFDLREY